MMESTHKIIANSAIIFATWTVTSFLCHQFGKIFLNDISNIMMRTGDSDDEHQISDGILGQIIPALLLTGCQLGCVVISVSLNNTKTISTSGLSVAKLTHALATLSTNLSMSMMSSSSTFAIKMMEPVTSAIVLYIHTRKPVSPWTVYSLPFIVGGAIAFAGNLLAIPETAVGMGMAFASNIILAFRNVAIKRLSTTNNSLPLKVNVNGDLGMKLLIAVVLGIFSLLYLESQSVLPEHTMYIIVCMSVSGTFHVVYSYVSTAMVLTQISVVSHAVANIMKRLLVVLLLYAFGQRIASAWNFMGLLVCTAGLMVYAWDKSKNTPAANNDEDAPRVSIGKKWSIFGIWAIICLATISFSSSSFNTLTDASRLSINYGIKKRAPLIQSKGIGLTPSNMNRYLDTPYSHHQFKLDLQSELNAFQANGFQKPRNTQLLPNLNTSSLREFFDDLKLPAQNVTNVNFLSKKLSTSNEIIKETQRLHFSIIGKELEKFKYAFLIDLADFENKGDSAITVGENYFLARMGIEIIYYCSVPRCTMDRLKKARNLAKEYKPDELVILLQGGGNIIAYPARDIVRFNAIDLFPTFKIFQFPQSIWIPSGSAQHVNKTVKYFCCNPNLTVVLRDMLSYSIAKTLYNGTTRLIMAPDMAFEIGHVPRFMSPVYDIMWIKRADVETPGYHVPKHIPQNLRVHISDWREWKTQRAGSAMEHAVFMTTNGFFYLQRGRVVITDRLHGHILSVLMDIPHVLIDNKAKKLSSYHNTWTKSLSNTVITDDPSKALDLAIGLLKKYNDTLPPVVQFPRLLQNFQRAATGVPDSSFT